MNMTDDQIQQKIRREILEGKDPAEEEDTPEFVPFPGHHIYEKHSSAL